jgi:hypothetical protein
MNFVFQKTWADPSNQSKEINKPFALQNTYTAHVHV